MSAWRYLVVWATLLLLLALSIATAYVEMGVINILTNIGIAIVKTLLVMLFFMHLSAGSVLVRVFASVGFLWLLLLLGLIVTDYLFRHQIVPPG